MKEESPRKTITKLPNHQITKLRIAIVVAEWHSKITEALYDAAHSTLLSNGCSANNIQRYDVPGSFELLFAAKELASTEVDAVICLGCVIRGETPHFDYICDTVAHGIGNLNLTYNLPFIFGVLTTNTLKQAQERAGGKEGNKGTDAALAALQMIQFKKKIKIPV